MRNKNTLTNQTSEKNKIGISRLQFMSMSATALCGLGLTSVPLRAVSAEGGAKMKIGISTLGFSGHTNASLAKELAGEGIRVVQLFLNQSDSKCWKYNGRTDVSAMTPERCREIAAAYKDAGVAIHSIGVYTNLIHPDEAERKANLEYFDAMMNIGSHMGVHTFITESGHYHNPKEPGPAVPLHFQDAVWPQMINTAKQLATMAEKYQSKVLMEPFFEGFFASAKRLRMFLEEVNSPAIRALLDAANLIEINDLEEMFGQLTPWIDCIHAKDRKLHTNRGVAAGKGDIDYPKFIKLAAKNTPTVPLVLEYVGAKDYKDAVSHLRNMMKQAGVAEG
ncbi:MAG: sugar phosphate isomerase/epimerase [Kiritimatiellae bacterium]|nr:sugar phosphate isomerase/epimerase [Kiritimatiellia bacterium]